MADNRDAVRNHYNSHANANPNFKQARLFRGGGMHMAADPCGTPC